MKKKHKVLKIVLISVGGFFATILTIVGAFLIYASATTLKVEDECSVDINGNASKSLNSTDTVKIMSWNIGYASLDEEADFFMDGGKTTRGISKEKTEENLKALKEKMVENDPDILMVQEIDIDSHRSHRVNELNSFKETFREDTYTNDFAFNYKAGYVPYPIPTIGKVNSGISTFSKYQMQDAKRVQLPIPFSWPVSLVNLKRCLLINRIHLEDVDKDLVVINLHLEAYDDGEGKTKQFNMLSKTRRAPPAGTRRDRSASPFRKSARRSPSARSSCLCRAIARRICQRRPSANRPVCRRRHRRCCKVRS